MELLTTNKISDAIVNSYNKRMTLAITKKLEEDNFPLEWICDWHLLRELAIYRLELTSKYISFLN